MALIAFSVPYYFSDYFSEKTNNSSGIFLGAPVSNLFRNILPSANQTYDLGSTTPVAEWKNVFTQNLTVSGTCTGCGGGSLSGGSANTLTYWVNGTTVGATSSPTVGYITATTTATSTFTGGIQTSMIKNTALAAANCDVKAIASNGTLYCGTDSTTAGTDPFVWNTTYGVLAAASSSPFWFQSNIYASSTIVAGDIFTPSVGSYDGTSVVGFGNSLLDLSSDSGEFNFHAGGNSALLSVDNIINSDKTFTFPNWSGDFVVSTSTTQVSSIYATTTATSTLPRLSSSGISSDWFCFTGDNCRTTWPTLASAASSTLLVDSNTFSGNNNFTASTTFSAQLNYKQATSSQLTVTGKLYAPLSSSIQLSATTTMGTGTTTIKMSGSPQAFNVTEFGCVNGGAGTFNAWFGDGTASSSIVTSASGNTTTFTTISSNNSFTRGESFYLAFGDVSGTVALPSCSYTKITQ